MNLQCLLRRCFFAIILTCWYPVCQADDPKFFNVIQKLHATLLNNYDKDIRPVYNHTEAVNLETNFDLTSFRYDDLEARFYAVGFFRMTWEDPRLKWSPSDYDGLKTIRLPSSKIWLPDLEVYNVPDGFLSEDRSFAANTNVVIYSQGEVLFVPMSNLVSVCISNPTLYPFDEVKCTIDVGSWTHSNFTVNLILKDNATKAHVSDLISSKMSQWDLVDSDASILTKFYECCPDAYQWLKLSFSLKRSFSTLKAITTPTIVIMILTLSTFFIPPAVSAKLLVGVINLVMICAYLLYFHATLPSENVNTPLIVSFYSDSLVLVIISIIINIFSLYCVRLSTPSPPPTFIQHFLDSRIGHILLLPQRQGTRNIKLDAENVANRDYLNKNDCGDNATQQWMNLCLALDRIMFILYCLIFSFLIVSCLV